MNIYLSPNGSDEGQGTKSKPFRSFTKAFEKAGKCDTQESLKIILLPGDYMLDKGIHINKNLGGSLGNPLIICAEKKQTVRLIGGQKIASLKAIASKEVLKRIPSNAKKYILEIDLADLGIRNYGRFNPRGFSRPTMLSHIELIFNHQILNVSRWPYNDFVQIDSINEKYVFEHDSTCTLSSMEGGFYFHDAHIKKWKDWSSAVAYGYWCWDWAGSYENIQSYNPETGHLRFKKHKKHTYGLKCNQRFYFLSP